MNDEIQLISWILSCPSFLSFFFSVFTGPEVDGKLAPMGANAEQASTQFTLPSNSVTWCWVVKPAQKGVTRVRMASPAWQTTIGPSASHCSLSPWPASYGPSCSSITYTSTGDRKWLKCQVLYSSASPSWDVPSCTLRWVQNYLFISHIHVRVQFTAYNYYCDRL